jgi:hypothetical protein
MKLVNTTKFDRKSGVAQWRDLRFAFGFNHCEKSEGSPQ